MGQWGQIPSQEETKSLSTGKEITVNQTNSVRRETFAIRTLNVRTLISRHNLLELENALKNENTHTQSKNYNNKNMWEIL